MAQWIARETSNLKVVGSSPTMDFFNIKTSSHYYFFIIITL